MNAFPAMLYVVFQNIKKQRQGKDKNTTNSTSSTPSSSSSSFPYCYFLSSINCLQSHYMMRAHTSQYVWYRRLFVLFSSYTFINILKKIHQKETTQHNQWCSGTKRCLSLHLLHILFSFSHSAFICSLWIQLALFFCVIYVLILLDQLGFILLACTQVCFCMAMCLFVCSYVYLFVWLC